MTPTPSQHPQELADLLKFVRNHGIRSYLEVGARRGGTFHAVVSAMPTGSLALALDMPMGCWGQDSEADLTAVVEELRGKGYDACVAFGDSQDADTADYVTQFGTFDLVLIDADHTYAGVKCDWQLYGPMGRFVAFHDIVGSDCTDAVSGLPVEVPRLWQELRREHHVIEEIIGDNSIMGIGILEVTYA